MSIETLGTLVGIAGATIGGSYAFVSKVIKPGYTLYKKHFGNLESIPLLADDVRWMKDQIKPNGGTSLRDLVDRIAIAQVVQGQVLNNMLALSSTGHFKTNREGLVVEVSRNLCRVMERSEQELMGNTWLSWIVNSDRDRVQAEWSNVIRLGREMDQEFKIWADGGATHTVRMKAMQLLGPDRQLVGYLGVMTVIDSPENGN